MSLTSAHRGYEYQDLLVACCFVDMLLGSTIHVHVDKKLVPDDRFDDLTTEDVDGNRERVQFKHTDNNDRPLTLKTFTTDKRGLGLDRLIESILTDRDGPGCNAHKLTFRIVLRDQEPQDPSLMQFLRRLNPPPAPFLPGLNTVRLGFDATAIWNQRNEGQSEQANGRPFAFLFTEDTPLSYDDLEWVCKHLVVEVGAPPSSADLTAPGLAEKLLLTRVHTEVGAESFPNVDRASVDVAAALISAARAARQDRLEPTATELLRRAQLRSDFGAVSRAYPVDSAIEVSRPTAVRQLIEEATELARNGGHLIIMGPPGHGKSWVSQQLFDALSNEGWLTAEHYCYLGDADGEQTERVLAEAIFGSLVGRLAEAEPTLIQDHRPRFAADEAALVECLRQSRRHEPNRRVALVIDGIDHVTRVCARSGVGFDPSRSLAEALSLLDLPPGVVVIVLSQPGPHLKPLEDVGAKTVDIPGLDDREISLLAVQLNVIPDSERQQSSTGGTPLIEEAEAINEFLVALAERSKGNALYATYLCREMLRRGDTHTDFAAAVLSLPPFDGTLKNYYEHLYEALGPTADWVAQIIALVDFAVTRIELREIKPDRASYVDKALAVLEPVLIERVTQGGVRVYHESFARYLRDRDEPIAVKDLLTSIANWLDRKGFLNDPRAFRSLLTLFSQTEEDERVIDLIDQAFVTNSVAVGFPSSGILANLAIAIRSAARLGNWSAIVRYVEMSRGVHSYQRERFDSMLVAFADVPASLLGADTLATRLIDDDRRVMEARAGLQMCAAVDALGATAPWRAYMIGHLREAETNNTSYGEASDRAVELAWLRGRLRLGANSSHNALENCTISKETETDLQDSDNSGSDREWNLTAPINWTRFAEWVESADLPVTKVISAIEDTHGWNGIIHFVHSLENPGEVCLALAERLANKAALDGAIGSPRLWAIAAAAHGVLVGSMHRLLKLGIAPENLIYETVTAARERLLDSTRCIQERSVRWENGNVGAWLDACTLAAYLDPLGLNTAEALIAGDGWYRCWLRFVIALSRAEAAEPTDQGALAVEAIQLLMGDLNPFSGAPRACDLYPLHDMIEDTIRRAMDLLDDDQWEKGLAILKTVSTSVTVTIRGEMGGPVPPDFLLRIAVNGAKPTRYSVAEAFLENEIAEGSANRFYADLAEYRLLAARLALIAEDRERTQQLWREACTFLTAYGWRKDITIYEVLDPLPILIKSDPARARLRVAAVQSLCERVPRHTDGKGTHQAWSRWWELLAKADPVAAIHLAVPQLLSQCNAPNSLLNDALEDVWQEWYEQADPLLAGALRLTLDTSLHLSDVHQLECLANELSADGPTVIQQLMTWLLARIDERPVSYSYSNSAELIAKDDEEVAKINEIAVAANLPPVVTIRDGSTVDSEQSRRNDTSSAPISPIKTMDELVVATFSAGLPGLARAIRVWHRRPYDSQSPKWSMERFANIIGYRLIELTTEGRYEEAESALRSLAGDPGFRERSSILRPVAEGLERHGEVRLAAVACTLIWTRTQGGSGWLTFGGETEIDALQRATALDSQIACEVIAEEIERVIGTSRYEIYGISQAMIHAFSVGALVCPDRSSLDVAFTAWDEAFAVIEARAPRVDTTDDPEVVYRPPDPDFGEPTPGDLEAALALAALGALAHPSREKKRRAFLAAQLFLNERPGVAAPAFDIALGAISDSATLAWLLRLIESSDERSLPVLISCQNTLRDLVSRNRLTVRALARRLLSGDQPPLVPPSPAHNALLGENHDQIWIPNNVVDLSPEEPVGLDGLLDAVAGTRLQRGEQFLPGLRRAVRACATSSLNDEAHKKRLKSQLDKLADSSRKRWPNAFLALEETIEDTLQSSATGGRTARFMAGELISNPVEWESELASALLDDPTVPLILEAHRQPRPCIAPPPNNGHEVWAHIRESAADGSSSSIVESAKEDNCVLGTLTIKPASSAYVMEGGKFGGWRWFATVESRFVKHPDWRCETDLFAKRYCALEIRNENDQQALTCPPVTNGDLRMWNLEVDYTLETPLTTNSQPLVGIDYELIMADDGQSGLGVPSPLLVPTAALIALLQLYPGVPCSYEDKNGLALALVTWRTEYDSSDYHLAWPRTWGCGIVIRPDLLARLISAVGAHRLVLRDFVTGNLGA